MLSVFPTMAHSDPGEAWQGLELDKGMCSLSGYSPERIKASVIRGPADYVGVGVSAALRGGSLVWFRLVPTVKLTCGCGAQLRIADIVCSIGGFFFNLHTDKLRSLGNNEEQVKVRAAELR